MKKIKFFCNFLIIFIVISCQSNFFYKNDFEKLRNHKASKILREIFDYYVKINCPESATKGARAFDNRQFLMIREKFLVLNIEKNEFSEYVLHIAIAPKNKPQKIKTWRLVLQKSDDEKSGYEIIKFDEYEFISKDGKKWPFEKYSQYWI